MSEHREHCEHCEHCGTYLSPGNSWLCDDCKWEWLRAVDLRNAQSDREYFRLWDEWERRRPKSKRP